MLEKIRNKVKEFLGKPKNKTQWEETLDDALHGLSAYPPSDERHWKAMESLERLAKVKKDLIGDDVEAKENWFQYITKRIFETATDPRVIVAAVTSVVYVWWGKTCMYYDQEGHIPPSRMMGNGPKPPKT